MKGWPAKCSTCFYWYPDKDGKFGSCHRFPPTVLASILRSDKAEFPETYNDDWCGEWKLDKPTE